MNRFPPRHPPSFTDNVKAFTINVETDSRNFDYTIETEDVTQRYNAMNNAGPAAGQTGCPALFSHNFGNGPKVANVTFRMPRSAKRSDLIERQGGFSLPSIQINEVT